eukprot:scaffold189393_cov35-Tisochrysis_lutea.AAC.2
MTPICVDVDGYSLSTTCDRQSVEAQRGGAGCLRIAEARPRRSCNAGMTVAFGHNNWHESCVREQRVDGTRKHVQGGLARVFTGWGILAGGRANAFESKGDASWSDFDVQSYRWDGPTSCTSHCAFPSFCFWERCDAR